MCEIVQATGYKGCVPSTECGWLPLGDCGVEAQVSPERREETINLGHGPLSASSSAGSTSAEGKVHEDRSARRPRYLGRGGGVLMGKEGPMLNSLEPLDLECGNAGLPNNLITSYSVGRRNDPSQAQFLHLSYGRRLWSPL